MGTGGLGRRGGNQATCGEGGRSPLALRDRRSSCDPAEHLDRSFEEQAENLRRLLDELDRAMSSDTAHAADALGATTTLAIKSPLHDL